MSTVYLLGNKYKKLSHWKERDVPWASNSISHIKTISEQECDFSNEEILQVLQALQKTVIIHNGLLDTTFHCPRKIPEFVVFETMGGKNHCDIGG